MDLGLQGKVAIVTGAGRGIGKGIALKFAQERARVAINDIVGEVAEQAAAEARALGVQAIGLQADVSKPDEVQAMVDRVLREMGRIDALVNNAGIRWEGTAPAGRSVFVETRYDEWLAELGVILLSAVNCSKAVLPHMMERGSGRIVHIASDSGRVGFTRNSVYGASKGGVISLTRHMAMEAAAHGVTVNAVSPGFIRSSRAVLAEEAREQNPESYEFYKHVEEAVVKNIPLGRVGHPEDVANLVVFLASDAASYITGQTYSVNGGLNMF